MELIALTPKEVRRLEVLTQVEGGSMTQAQAGLLLALSARQVRRLLRAYRRSGAAGLASRKRARPPNNALDPELIARILEYCRGPYAGFGPTFAAEKLRERNSIEISSETLRQLLMRHKLWKGKRRKIARHLPRDRRAQFGELLQADGSPHDWFEGRAPKCSLLCAIGDATGQVGAARFEEAETTDGYFALFTEHFGRHGLPGAVYVDRHEIFRINQLNCDADEKTQVGRAFEQLGIELLCANSPQAKGRIERLNRTWQDRLTKELRLRNISSIEQANAFLPQWTQDHNRRFAIAPASPIDAHRGVEPDLLERVLCRQYERVLSRHGMVQLDNALYALEPRDGKALHAGLRVTVHLYLDGRVAASHPTRKLDIRFVKRHERRTKIVGSKELSAQFDRHIPNPKKAHTLPPNHPWRQSRNTPASLARGHF